MSEIILDKKDLEKAIKVAFPSLPTGVSMDLAAAIDKLIDMKIAAIFRNYERNVLPLRLTQA